MSTIRWTEQDISLYAKVLERLRPHTLIVLAVYIFAVSIVTFGQMAPAIICTAIGTIAFANAVYFIIRKQARKVWHAQAPDGLLTVDISEAGWRIATSTIRTQHDWSIYVKYYEFMRCYALILKTGQAMVYRKDYFSPEEQRLIESKIRKVKFWLL